MRLRLGLCPGPRWGRSRRSPTLAHRARRQGALPPNIFCGTVPVYLWISEVQYYCVVVLIATHDVAHSAVCRVVGSASLLC